MASSTERDDSRLLKLPFDVQLEILKFCDVKTLGRISQTCKSLNQVVDNPAVWIPRGNRALFTNQVNKPFRERSSEALLPKKKCQISNMWVNGECARIRGMVSKERFIPWLQMEKRYLWYSRGRNIYGFRRYATGISFNPPRYLLHGHNEDVVRFCSTPSYIVSGGRDCQICIWDKNGVLRCSLPLSHQRDVNSICCDENIMVSGSRDRTVKLWSFLPRPRTRHTFDVGDNIWDVALIPSTKFFLTGSAALHGVHPLKLFDAERCAKVTEFGVVYRRGAGISHICPESPYEFLTGSYDATVRLWDIRTPRRCVNTWDDPNNSVVYCVDSDHYLSFVSGTIQHGVTCLWDKRASRNIGAFYTGSRNSPVYSVAFDPYSLYIALDRGLYLYSFYPYD